MPESNTSSEKPVRNSLLLDRHALQPAGLVVDGDGKKAKKERTLMVPLVGSGWW